MREGKDLTGRRFGRFVAIKRVGSKRNNALWLCKCDCGNEKEIIAKSLIHGEIRSCGCLKTEISKRPKETKKNKYEVINGIVVVQLENTEDKLMCDLEDWERLKNFTWFKTKTGYAATHKREERISKFHIEVMGKKKGMVIDHINRNPLDNRKCNLRFVTQHANTTNTNLSKSNTSGIKGVSWLKENRKWMAYIKINGKMIYLGCYEDIKDAELARKKAEKEYFEPLFKENRG